MLRLRALAPLLPPLALSAWAYWPITANYFHADDFQYLYLLADGRLGELLVTPHGGHLLVARNALFALTHALFGLDPRGYFWIALLTHLLNVGLLFAVVRAATGRRWLACGAAALWGVSPLNAEALGWYSVYGQVVLATVVLAVLWRLTVAAASGGALSRRAALGCYLALLAGATCFGTGIGVAMALGAGGGLFLPGAAHRSTRRLFATLLAVVPALYVLVHLLYRAVAGQAHGSMSYAGAALSSPLGVIYMSLHMLAFGAAGTLVGPWPPLLASGVALPAVAGLCAVGLAVALWAAAPAARRLILGCLLLAVAAYGIIAAGRASAVQGRPWLVPQIAESLRYHYAPPLFLVIAGAAALAALAARAGPLPNGLGAAAGTAALAALAAGLYRWPPSIDHYDAERGQVASFLTTLQRRAAAAPPGEPIVLLNGPMHPVNDFTPMWVFPGRAGLFITYVPENVVDGHPVRFLTRQPGLFAAARRRPASRLAALLVMEDEAGRLTPAAAPRAGAPATPRSAPDGESSRGATR